MRIRFLADADLNQKIVEGLLLLERAIDIQTAAQGEILDLPDPVVPQLAGVAGRILVTHDRRTMPRNFSRLPESVHSPGVIVVDQNMGIGDAIRALHLIWAASDAHEYAGKVYFV